jgi:hypothetical protein
MFLALPCPGSVTEAAGVQFMACTLAPTQTGANLFELLEYVPTLSRSHVRFCVSREALHVAAGTCSLNFVP